VSDRNLFEQQAANRRRSFWLVAAFVAFFAWIGFGGDLAFYLATASDPPPSYHHIIPWFGLVAMLVAIVTAAIARATGAKRILWSTGAREMVEPVTPQERQYRNVVEEMTIAAGLPMPRLWIVPDADPNAFATGADAEHANIAVTAGLLAALSRDELQGVIAHELSHVRNDDMKLMTLLAAMLGIVALLSDGMRRYLWSGGRVGSSRDDDDRSESKGPLAIVVFGLWLGSLLVAPLVTRLLAMAVSRKREFLADATAAQFTRNPGALADALARLASAPGPTRTITTGAAHLCIIDPSASSLSESEGWVPNLLATHPPLGERIRRLRAMAFQPDQVVRP
jgi:heat shock protein HtpX